MTEPNEIRIILPPYKVDMMLHHNDHKGCFQTAKEEIETGDCEFDDDRWGYIEDKQKAIDTNEIWTLRWSPDSPVGSRCMHFASIESLNSWVRSVYYSEPTSEQPKD